MYFLLTSPHPDDDQVGLADYMQHLLREGHVVGVWFMTDGHSCQRRIEATKALNLIGIKDVFWYTMPFYDRRDRKVTESDTKRASQLLEGIRPDAVAVCYDADPHGTHMKCFAILQRAIGWTGGGCGPVLSPDIVLYHSAWAATTTYIDHLSLVQWKVKDANAKRRALQCHASQLTLKTHDGFGSSLLERGNVVMEAFHQTSTARFISLAPCHPNLRRRTVFTKDVGKYVFDHHVRDLPAESRVIFPTGNTPLGLYQHMRQVAKTLPPLDVYQLDEYINSTEYRDYLIQHLPEHYRFHFIDAGEATCERALVTHDLACQQLDVVFLGIGVNGHIAFNEPPSDATSATRIIALSPSTVAANGTHHTHAATLGIRTILTAKKIVLLALKNKHPILDRVFEGDETIPAAALARHPCVEFVVEEA